MAKRDIKAEAIRLRREHRLSYNEIQKRTGASKGSLSLWLREYPLTKAEKKALHLGYKPGRARTPRGEPSKFLLALEGQELTRPRKARISEAAVLFRLALHKWVVSKPIFDGSKYDWLAANEDSGRILKIQVRSVLTGRRGRPTLSLRCSNGRTKYRRYRDNEFDAIVGYDLFTDTAYVFVRDELKNKASAVAICDDAAERWDKLEGL